MSDYTFITDRLKIRKYTLADANFLFHLINSPKWKRFIGDRGVNSLKDAEVYIREKYLSAYEEYGFGAYICERRLDSVIVGTCGFYKRPNLDHPDIGFALLPEHEGKGYAYEAASGLMKYGKEYLNISEIYGITLPKNEASIKLLKKLGLSLTGSFRMEGDDEELLLFST